MQIPMVGIYLPLYDQLLDNFRKPYGPAAPVLASSIARSAAVLMVAPLELFRTRLQAGVTTKGLLAGTWGGASTAWRSAWTGVGATILRDIPFSAIYWGLVEYSRGALIEAL